MPPPPPTPSDSNGGDARRDAGQRRPLTDDEKASIRAAQRTFQVALSDPDGGREHPRVRAWLAARGISMDWLNGGRVPRNLIFSSACEDYSFALRRKGQFPAMVARCETPHDPPHEITLVHRTYFEPERAAKRAESEEWGAARKHRGVRNGHVIWLSPRQLDEWERGEQVESVKVLGPYPFGVLCLSEGIENGLSVFAASGLATASCLDVHGLRTVAIDPELFNPYTADGFYKPDGHWIHTIVLVTDLDANRVGQDAALDAYERFGVEHPRLMVRQLVPSSALPGGLVEIAQSGEMTECRTCKGTGKAGVGRGEQSCANCRGRGELGFRRGEDRPRLGADGFPIKGVDWNDVLMQAQGGGEVAKGVIHAAVQRCIRAGYGSFDEAIAAAAKKSINWKPDAVVNTAGVIVVASSEPSRVAPAGTPREAPALEKEGGGAGKAGDGISAGGGGGWWDGSCGGILSWFEGYPGPVISPGPLERARAFLIQQCRPGEGMRRFRLLNWGGQWWWFDDVAWRKIDDTQLAGMVHNWLNGFHHLKRWKKKDVPEIVRIHPKFKDVAEIMKCLAAETYAAVNEMPAWLPPSLDEHGNPTWGLAVKTWEFSRGGRSGVRHEHGEAREYIVFENGLLDRRALVRERQVRLVPVTSDLFTQAVHPYPLDVMSLQQLLAGGAEGAGLKPAVMHRICPAFWQGLQDATADSPRVEQLRRQRVLGLMFGDTIGADRRIEKIHLVLGPQRAFKGCIEEGIKAMVGDENVAMTSFFDLGGDRFALAPLVGRSTGIMSDAHVGQMMDSTLAVERLKTIRGNGSVAVRDLYQAARPNVRLKIRFWIFCNDEPDKLQDNSGAMAGSFVIWPATVSFFGREDPTVKERIAREGPGIAVWALYWHAELFASDRPKIEMDDLGKAIAEELADSGSNMRQFLKECCVCDEVLGMPRFNPDREIFVWYRDDVGGQIGLYDVYQRWCERNDKKPLAANKLVGKIRPLVPGVTYLKQKRLGQPDSDGADGDPRKRVLYGIALRPGLDPALLRGATTPTVGYGRSPAAEAKQGGMVVQYTSPDEALPFDDAAAHDVPG